MADTTRATPPSSRRMPINRKNSWYLATELMRWPTCAAGCAGVRDLHEPPAESARVPHLLIAARPRAAPSLECVHITVRPACFFEMGTTQQPKRAISLRGKTATRVSPSNRGAPAARIAIPSLHSARPHIQPSDSFLETGA